jgi:hypothetical protein
VCAGDGRLEDGTGSREEGEALNSAMEKGWHFIIVKKKEIIEKMANAVQSVADQIASWSEACHGKRT